MLRQSFFGLVLLISAPAAAGDAALARGPVEHLNDTLLIVMRDAKSLGFTGRYETLDPVLRATFDFPEMARVATGRHWQALAPAQQQTLVDRFTRMSIATLADRFDGHAGERFEIARVDALESGAFMVRTRMIGADGSATPVDYTVKSRDDGWRVVDVFVNGRFSEITVRRSEYTSVLRRQGPDGLIEALDKQLARLQGDSS